MVTFEMINRSVYVKLLLIIIRKFSHFLELKIDVEFKKFAKIQKECYEKEEILAFSPFLKKEFVIFFELFTSQFLTNKTDHQICFLH